MTSKHTPTPWRVFTGFADPEIVSDKPTARETESIVQFKGQRNAVADAHFIVRACNSHAPLVAALDLLASAAARLAAAVDGTTDQFDHELRCLNQTRSTALATLHLARGAS